MSPNLRGTAFILICNLNPIKLSSWDSLGFHWTQISAILTSDPHFHLPPCFINTVSRPQITHMRDLHLSFLKPSVPHCTGLHADCISPWASLLPQALKSQFNKLHKAGPCPCFLPYSSLHFFSYRIINFVGRRLYNIYHNKFIAPKYKMSSSSIATVVRVGFKYSTLCI